MVRVHKKDAGPHNESHYMGHCSTEEMKAYQPDLSSLENAFIYSNQGRMTRKPIFSSQPWFEHSGNDVNLFHLVKPLAK